MKCDDTIQALQIQAVSKEIVHSVWKDHLWQGRVFADCPGNATRLSSGQQRRHHQIIAGILRPPWARGSHRGNEAVILEANEAVVLEANKAVNLEANEAIVFKV
jgi:hypothetical protein